MSLGNNPDQEFIERHRILHSAAELMARDGLEESQAIEKAMKREQERYQAESKGDVVSDENGHITDYLEEDLAHPRLEPTQRQLANRYYQSLCEKEGLDPI